MLQSLELQEQMEDEGMEGEENLRRRNEFEIDQYQIR